jgi:hypothetical protein
MVIANEQVEHAVACPACHGLDDLVGDGRDARVADGDSIEGLQVMDEV